KAAIRVSQHQEPVRLLREHHPLALGQDGAKLLAEPAPCPQVVIGLPHAKLLEKDVVQALVIVLPRMHQHLRALPVELLDNPPQTDNLRAGTQNRHDFHGAAPQSSRARRCWYRASSRIISGTAGARS